MEFQYTVKARNLSVLSCNVIFLAVFFMKRYDFNELLNKLIKNGDFS